MGLCIKKHYIGHIKDFERRIKEHERGKNKSVKNRGPFELIYKESCANKSAAIRRELQIKKYKGGEAFKKLIGQSVDPIV